MITAWFFIALVSGRLSAEPVQIGPFEDEQQCMTAKADALTLSASGLRTTLDCYERIVIEADQQGRQ